MALSFFQNAQKQACTIPSSVAEAPCAKVGFWTRLFWFRIANARRPFLLHAANILNNLTRNPTTINSITASVNIIIWPKVWTHRDASQRFYEKDNNFHFENSLQWELFRKTFQWALKHRVLNRLSYAEWQMTYVDPCRQKFQSTWQGITVIFSLGCDWSSQE